MRVMRRASRATRHMRHICSPPALLLLPASTRWADAAQRDTRQADVMGPHRLLHSHPVLPSPVTSHREHCLPGVPAQPPHGVASAAPLSAARSRVFR